MKVSKSRDLKRIQDITESKTMLYVKEVNNIQIGYVLSSKEMVSYLNLDYNLVETPHTYNYTKEVIETLPKYVTGFIPTLTRYDLGLILYTKANLDLHEKPKKEITFEYKNTFNSLDLSDYDISYNKKPIQIILKNHNIKIIYTICGLDNNKVMLEPVVYINNKKVVNSFVTNKCHSVLKEFYKTYKHYDNFKLLLTNNLNISNEQREARKNEWFPKLDIKK